MRHSVHLRFGSVLAAVMAVGLAAFALPAAASASTASISGGTLYIQGGPENNHLSFGGNSSLQKYIVDTAGITAGAGCSQLDPTEVECPTEMYTQISIDAGPGDDYVAFGWVLGMGGTARGGPGNDTIYGTDSNDRLYGDDGNDTIGAAGGADYVEGGPGNDTLSGEGGDDQIVGGPGRDSIHGDGNDVADSGNDTIDAVDGEADQIECGWGADIVNADAADLADIDCEAVNRPAPPKPAITMNAKATAKIASILKNGYSFTMNCGSATSFRSALVLRAAAARKLRLGKKDVNLAVTAGPVNAGTSYSVRLKVTKAKYRAALKRARKVKLDLVMSATSSGGSASAVRHLTFIH